MENRTEVTQWETTPISNIKELFIILVAGSTTLIWSCANKIKIGPFLRDITFSALDRLKKKDTQ